MLDTIASRIQPLHSFSGCLMHPKSFRMLHVMLATVHKVWGLGTSSTMPSNEGKDEPLLLTLYLGNPEKGHKAERTWWRTIIFILRSKILKIRKHLQWCRALYTAAFGFCLNLHCSLVLLFKIDTKVQSMALNICIIHLPILCVWLLIEINWINVLLHVLGKIRQHR